MINLCIQFRDLEEDTEEFFDIKYPYIPRIGEEMNCKIFSKRNIFATVKNVTYYPDKVEIYLRYDG